MIKAVILVCLLAHAVCWGEPVSPQSDTTQKKPLTAAVPAYPDADFIVLSDLHYLSPELRSAGSAFERCIDNDRKMFWEGPAILDTFMESIRSVRADFVIVCGDLTKDGERLSHDRLSRLLARIEAQGKNVYIVPGNHDINNSESMTYAGPVASRVATVSPGEFSAIYRDFGFGEAIERDAESLSYVVEPVPGLWVLALDSCRYRENPPDGHTVTGGKFSPATIGWIQRVLAQAAERNKAAIGFLHHPVLAHYRANNKFNGEYLIEDAETISRLFAEMGLRLVFTGHYHGQNITGKSWPEGHFLFDILTGSLVTWPVPWRTVAIRDRTATIQTHYVQAIAGYPREFQDYARRFIIERMTGGIEKNLAGIGMTWPDSELLASRISSAYAGHFKGSRQSGDSVLDLCGLSAAGMALGIEQQKIVRGWYSNLPPSDTALKIDLVSGAAEDIE